MRATFSIQLKKDANFVHISGLELIFIANKILSDFRYHNITQLPLEVFTQNNKIIILGSCGWLTLPNMIINKSKSPESFQVQITPKGAPVTIKGGVKRIVEFNAGGDYTRITHQIIAYQKALNLDARALAEVLKKRLRCQEYPMDFSQEQQTFFDQLLVLLFGVEASRFAFAAICGSILLDLIIAFPTKWNWNNVFKSMKNYQYDDMEGKDLGGKFPLAANSTGPGNFKKLNDMLRALDLSNYQDYMLRILTERQHHAVPIKAMTLLINWLIRLHTAPYEYLTWANNRNDLLSRIRRLFCKQLVECLSISSGMFSDLHKGAPGIIYQSNTEASLAAVLTRLSIFSTPYFLDENEPCIVYDHTAKVENKRKHKEGQYFHRTNIDCKLIPAYVQQPQAKNAGYLGMFSSERQELTLGQAIAQATTSHLKPCPYCYGESIFYGHRQPIEKILPKPSNAKEPLQKKLDDNDYACYEFNQLWEKLITFHVNDVQNDELENYFLCCYLLLVKEKNWDDRKIGILNTILNYIKKHFDNTAIDDKEKGARQPLVEAVILNIMPIIKKYYSREKLLAALKELFYSALRSSAGLEITDSSGTRKMPEEGNVLAQSLMSLHLGVTLNREGGKCKFEPKLELMLEALNLYGDKPPQIAHVAGCIVETKIPGFSFREEEYNRHLRSMIAAYFRTTYPSQFENYFRSLCNDTQPIETQFGKSPFNYFYALHLEEIEKAFFENQRLKEPGQRSLITPFNSLREHDENFKLLNDDSWLPITTQDEETNDTLTDDHDVSSGYSMPFPLYKPI